MACEQIAEVSFGNTSLYSKDLENAPVTWVGKALNLDSKVELKFIFDPLNYGGDLADLHLQVAYTDVMGDPVSLSVEHWDVYDESMGYYSFTLDTLLAALDQKITELQGYVEMRESHNGNMGNLRRSRYVDMTIRIPAADVDAFAAEVSGIANVVSKNVNREDITLQYTATSNRVTALETEEARLLELLAKAENMSDLLEIEARLTDVRYELENVTSQLRVLANQVDYATIYLYISQVKVYTEVEEQTVWQRIGSGFKENLQDIGEDLTDFFVWVITYSPQLILWAIIIAVAVTQLGYGETNGGYTKYGEFHGNSYADWCGYFVSWCARQANVPTSVLPKQGWAKPSGWGLSTFTANERMPQPGDLYFRGTAHVGFVYYVSGNYFYTLEGNTSTTSADGTSVMIRKRKISDFYFSSPNYSGNSCSHNYETKVESDHPHKEFKVCTKCNRKTYTGNTITDSNCKTCIQEACSHTFGSWIHNTDSKHKRVCSKCEYEENKSHNWTEGKVLTEPTCVKEGARQVVCNDCGAVVSKGKTVAKLKLATPKATIKGGKKWKKTKNSSLPISQIKYVSEWLNPHMPQKAVIRAVRFLLLILCLICILVKG